MTRAREQYGEESAARAATVYGREITVTDDGLPEWLSLIRDRAGSRRC